MTPTSIPVFINGRALSVAAGSTLAELLAEHEPGLLALLLGGASATDARGLPVAADVPVVAGAIYRLQRSARVDQVTDA